MTRKDILESAAKAVLKDRQTTHGAPEQSFTTIANLWTAYLEAIAFAPKRDTLKPQDVAILMALMKIARLASVPTNSDSWTDVAGYAACGAELATEGKGDGISVSDYVVSAEQPSSPQKESCKPANSSLTPQEAVDMSRLAHLIAGQTLKEPSPEVGPMLLDAILRPTTCTYRQYQAIYAFAHSINLK